MTRFLLGKPAKFFRERRLKKARMQKKRQIQFRKGFKRKSSEPKSFDVKPNLPTRGTSRTKTFKRRIKGLF